MPFSAGRVRVLRAAADLGIRTVAVYAIDDAGANLDPAVKSAVESLLEAMREVNFVVKAADPTRSNVEVAATVEAYDGFDHAQVKAAAEVALAEYLDPAEWGRPNFGDEESNPGWVNSTVVRLYEIAEVLNRVDGVHYVSALTINGVAADLTMAGVVALPNVVDPATDLVVTVAP